MTLYNMLFGSNPNQPALEAMLKLPPSAHGFYQVLDCFPRKGNKRNTPLITFILRAKEDTWNAGTVRSQYENFDGFEEIDYDALDVKIGYVSFKIPERFVDALTPFILDLEYKFSARFSTLTKAKQGRKKNYVDPLTSYLAESAEPMREALKKVIECASTAA